MPSSPKRSKSRYYVRAVERALTLLRVFLNPESEISATDISRRVGLDLSTTFRLLVTLESQGFIEQDPSTGRYRLGVTCLELGSQYLKNNDIRERSLGVMEALRDDYGETVHLTILEGNEVVYLEKVSGMHPIGLMASRVGRRAPAHCTGVGKALLAYLPFEEVKRRHPDGKLVRYTDRTITEWDSLQNELTKIRAQGYAVDEQEREVGVKCVAVPIFDHKGIAAAVSVSGPAERMNQHIEREGLVEKVQGAAAEITARMGGRPMSDHGQS